MAKQNNTPNRAGFVITGNDSKGVKSILMSFTQGRFSINLEDTKKNYSIPKGTVDPGEDPFEAAWRETEEETGISVPKLLGEERFERYQKGKKIEPFVSEGYPGVKVVMADRSACVTHEHKTNTGKRRTMQLYTIEVENIDALKPYLKALPDKVALPDDEKTGLPSASVGIAATDYMRDHGYRDLSN